MKRIGWREGALAALVAVALASPAGALAAAGVRATVDPAEAHVGDEIRFDVNVTFAAGSDFQPPRGAKFDPLVLKRFEATERKDPEGRTVGVTYHYVLAGFEVGDYDLPPLGVTVLEPGAAAPEELETTALKVRIASLLSNEDKEPRDILGPVDLLERNRPLLYALAALGLLVLGGALGWWLYKRFGGRRTETTPAEPLDLRTPEAWALDELARIEALDLTREDDRELLKAHTFETTEVLRAYLGRKFGFESLEMTTAELVAELRARKRSDAQVEGFLVDTDYLKFGRSALTRADVADLLPRARALVEEVRAREERRAPIAPPAISGASDSSLPTAAGAGS
ncbi:MAG: hypothetical protein KC466_12050 [Myxococcales bacterium]|nr:hypothetical protein [Myxococcales bacterium]